MACLSTHHGVTSIGAELAGVGTVFAVIHSVFRAFGAARLAGLGAQRADRVSLCTLTRDGCCCQATNVGAFQVQCNAVGHHFWLIFIQASSGALEARRSTIVASAKTLNFFLTQHVHVLWILPKIRCANLMEKEDGRLCVNAQKLSEEFSVSQANDIDLSVLPHRRRLAAGVTSSLRIPNCGVRCRLSILSMAPEVSGLRRPNSPGRMTPGRMTVYWAHSHFFYQSNSSFHQGKIMKNLRAVALGTVPVLTTDVSFAQGANMMNDGVWGNNWMGGYGGIWMPILMIIVVVAFVVWIVKQRK